MEKKQDTSVESACISSSSIKDELYSTKETSMKKKKGMVRLLERMRGKKYDNHRRKGVRTKPKPKDGGG